MYKIIAVLITAALVSFGCGKKDDSSVMKDVKPNTNQQQTQQQQTQQQQTQQQQTQQQQTQQQNSQQQTTQKNNGKADMVDFTYNDNGKKVKLSDHKGKVILVNFWATWCGPCRKELPDLSQISNELKDKDFKLVGVSVDDNQEILDRFLQSNKLSYPVFLDEDGLVAKYMSAAGQNQNAIPQTYIIDKNGKVVEAILGSRSKADFMQIINKYL